MRLATICIMGAVTGLAACAGREPILEPTLQATDAELDCKQLMLAHDDAVNRAVVKQQTQDRRDDADVALGVTGAILFWPALFFIDTKNADGAEALNLVARASSLRDTAAADGCQVASWKPIPELHKAPEPVAVTSGRRPETKLSGGAIRTAFVEHETEVMRGSLEGTTLRHASDGVLEGLAPGGDPATDGRWEIDDDRYCIEVDLWRDGRRSCYSVYELGEDEYRFNPGGGKSSYFVKVVKT